MLARKLFPYVALALCLASLAWAISFGTLPPADFTFINGTEIQSVDPAKVTGVPEGRILNAIFEGLYRQLPSEDDPSVLIPKPAIAESHTVSEDGKTYTFKIRREAAWTDGTPITAHDFEWSWRRFLHPEIASKYVYQLTSYVVGAKAYNSAQVEEGGKVEIELDDRPSDFMYPSGTILSGILVDIKKPPKPQLKEGASDDAKEQAEATWKANWVYEVEVKPEQDGVIDWQTTGKKRKFSVGDLTVEKCMNVLPHFGETVGIDATSEDTFVVELMNPTPFFLELCAFYPMFPVNQNCVEQYGSPKWTKPKNIVTSGPYLLEFRRIRDRVRMRKNPSYWAADTVALETIDALAVESQTTQINMYVNRQVDWATDVPNTIMPELLKRDDFSSGPILSTYFYRINVRREVLSDKRVRQALNMALNKQVICDEVLKAGQVPARALVPSGAAGYTQALCEDYNPARAKELLAEAGYPDGRGFPKVEILYNTSEAHRDVAEVIQQQWSNELGIEIRLKNLEWGSYLNTTRTGHYDIARAGWIGDYPDPNTFLDMWVTNGENNETGWSNKTYDGLIRAAAAEQNPKRRMEIMHQAEEILMDELPIIPIYFYVSINMVRPYVKGFHPTLQDIHPLQSISIDPQERQKFWESPN